MYHLLFLNVGGSELIIIALFVLMFFGSKSIPEFMRGLGKMTREFKDAMNGLESEVRNSVNFDVAADKPASTAEQPKQLEEKQKQLEEKAEEKKDETVSELTANPGEQETTTDHK